MGRKWTIFWSVWGLMMLVTVLSAQQPTPTLSTADKTAIQDAERQKQEAQLSFQKAQELELQVLREWESAHPGFKVNPQTFTVEPKPAIGAAAPTPHAPAATAPRK